MLRELHDSFPCDNDSRLVPRNWELLDTVRMNLKIVVNVVLGGSFLSIKPGQAFRRIRTVGLDLMVVKYLR